MDTSTTFARRHTGKSEFVATVLVRWISVHVLVWTAVSCGSISQSPPQRLDFKPLAEADYVIVCGSFCPSDTLVSIRDREKIEPIATFLLRYADGWRDSWNAPAGGVLNVAFYKGTRVIGTFGMTPASNGQAIISVGTLSRSAPSDEIFALTDRLGVVWPAEWRR